jgi:CheY-like chemotaxis protein
MNKQASPIQTHRILIVDDDDVLRRWLRAQLEPRGFEIWEESQGDEALASYSQNGPWDFVLSDLYFYPGEKILNGLDLVSAILALVPQQRLAIHSSESRIQAPCATLHKPYVLGALLRLLRRPLTPIRHPGEMNR